MPLKRQASRRRCAAAIGVNRQRPRRRRRGWIPSPRGVRPDECHRFLNLLWTAVCQAGQRRMPAGGAGICVGRGGGGSGWCATRGQTLMRGCTLAPSRRTGFRRESPLSKIERHRGAGCSELDRGCSRACARSRRLLDRRGAGRGSVGVRESPSRTRRARARPRPRRSCGACRARCRGAARRGAGAAAPAR